MPSRPWYPKYPGDYLADTAMLSLEAHGLYSLLLDYYWINGPLPDDETRLAKLLRVDRRKFRRTFAELLPYFSKRNGRIHNARMDREIAQFLDKSEKAATSAKTRWDANAKRRQCYPEPYPDPDSNYLSPDGDRSRNPVSTCPIQKIINLYHERLCPPLPKVLKRTSTRDSHIRSRWREHPSMENFQKFFDHVESSDFLMGKVNGSRGPFRPDLDWLMKPENFAKVIEGKYRD